MSTLGAENLYSFPKKPFSNEIWRRAATDAPCQSEPGIQIKAALPLDLHYLRVKAHEDEIFAVIVFLDLS